MGHGGFDMNMSVDQTGAKVGSLGVDLLPTGIGAYAQNDAVADGHIALFYGAGEHVDDVGILDDQGGIA